MKKVLLVFIVAIAGVAIGFYLQPLVSSDSINSQIRKFKEVLQTASENYVESVDTQKLTEAALRGMLNELDVHSVYLTAEEMKAVDEDFQGAFEGIGIQFDIINDTIVIVSPIPGGPSEALGIQAGDKIVEIEGENAVGIPRSDVPKKLKGPKGTKVQVLIVRPGRAHPIHFTITRDKIPFYSVDASFIVNGTDIGVIAVNRFSAKTRDEFVEALNKLKRQGMKKLILDLRGNPGGFLSQAFYIADELIPAGETIVYTKGRKTEFEEYFYSTGGGVYEKMPLIVLIDMGSASASEIVSGAVQDLDRGLVVGTTSFGKGLVQRQYEIGDGSAFRITISKYYTPSGRSIQRPYKDKDSYRRLVGRLELEEGLNIEHALEKIKKETHLKSKDSSDLNGQIDMDSIPIFYTKKGRPVLGGGGITPDYIVKMDTLTDLSVAILNNNLFLEFVNSGMNGEIEKIKKTYGDNFDAFYANYSISETVFGKFKALTEQKNIEWNEEEFAIDRDYLSTALKATVARLFWDREKFLQVFYTIDRQMKTALKLFPEAEKLGK